MVIVDLNSLIIPNIVQADKISESLIRHISINAIKSIVKKFRMNYSLRLGIVLVDDDSHSWRKDVFPYYKMNRAKSRINSKYDWNHIYEWLKIIKGEIIQYVPLKYIRVPNCEADDVIAVLSSFVVNTFREDVVIVSSDADFVQLHSPNIFQYSPLHRQFIKFKVSPTHDLFDKIFRGDRGDGIPNYLSDDDVFVNHSKKPKRVSNKRIYELLSEDLNFPAIYEKLYDNEKPGFIRNKKLIDFSEIPEKNQTDIINTFREILSKKQNTLNELVDYLKKYNLNYLLAKVGDFEE